MDTNGNGTCPDEGEPAGEYDKNFITINNPDTTVTEVDIVLPDEGICPLPSPIPTMTEFGMIAFVLLMAGSAIWVLRRRKSEN
ncbi:MAG: IPTL-CTERM sorting domain-containing protein [Deltaproteobacteria bacterium]|nr:IPTL-CTERM sorting domain-containing protein [Deltaproteobacteria bacterium]